MKFGPIDHYLSGVSVPVAALRSRESCGCGEFADLPRLGAWCATAGLDLIQILPVNDTGSNSSPYSALSAFALHPLYVRLEDVPGAGRYREEINRFRDAEEAPAKFSYARVLSFKTSLLGRIYSDTEAGIATDGAFARFLQDSSWLRPYAVFKAAKAAFGGASWRTWPELGQPSEAEIEEYWHRHSGECMFHSWVQYVLDSQLTRAARGLRDMGVSLKGDVPILMSEDSADVWSSRRYFELSMAAGAPPDMYSTDGQNWGFPVYNWKELERDGYAWWKGRLLQAARFFHAYRIDHVLGFFRIWRIPRSEQRGLLGSFYPSLPLTAADFSALGFDEGRVRWLAKPHVSTAEVAARLGADAERVLSLYFDRIGREELFIMKPACDAERAILGLAEPEEVKQLLLWKHTDRALLEVDADGFAPTWYFWESTPFKSLSPGEQERLRGLIDRRRRETEKTWEQRGRTLLGMMKETTDMLVCAEDLGDVPDCVPRVLSGLGIFGLRVARWAKDYKAPGEPFIPVERYPALSVCTASVHDTSTVRGWWEESPSEREAYCRYLGLAGDCPPHATPALLQRIASHLARTSSLLCVFQLQDFLDLDEKYWSHDPRLDRINVPGTVNDANWTWRMPVPLETLVEDGGLVSRIEAAFAGRRRRKAE